MSRGTGNIIRFDYTVLYSIGHLLQKSCCRSYAIRANFEVGIIYGKGTLAHNMNYTQQIKPVDNHAHSDSSKK